MRKFKFRFRLLLFLIVILSILDLTATIYFIHFGMKELNPIANLVLFLGGVSALIWFKLGLVGIAAGSLLTAEQKVKHKNKIIILEVTVWTMFVLMISVAVCWLIYWQEFIYELEVLYNIHYNH